MRIKYRQENLNGFYSDVIRNSWDFVRLTFVDGFSLSAIL